MKKFEGIVGEDTSLEETDYIENLIEQMNEEMNGLSVDELATYDIKLDLKDTSTGKRLYDIDNPYERVLTYRNDYSALGMSFEPDISIRVMMIFSMVFPYVNYDGRSIELQRCEGADNPYEYNKAKLKFQMGNVNEHGFVYRGDTMNSYMGTINSYRRIYGEDLPHEAMELLRLVHSIGNLTPVPFARKGEEFNSPRGFNNEKVNDYWDLTLLAIYNWFLKQNGKSPKYDLDLIDVVKTKESILMCEKWLGNFIDQNDKPSWLEFVRGNYMESFVEKDYGMPKELWEGHFDNYMEESRPTTKDEYIQFFTNARVAIWQRGCSICRAFKG